MLPYHELGAGEGEEQGGNWRQLNEGPHTPRLSSFDLSFPNASLMTPGKQKWVQLGLIYPLEGKTTPNTEQTAAFNARLQEAGLPVVCA